MGLIVNNLSYIHPDRETLFTGVSFALADGRKASLIGDNGSGKSTLIRIIAGQLKPASGEVSLAGKPYFIPQHFGQYDHLTVAGALDVERKIVALHAILAGDASVGNYDTLGDDWDIEQRMQAALDRWGLGRLMPDAPFAALSGGEKTRVFLAGIDIHDPRLVLMDEPTNHLDRAARQQLYALVARSTATMLIVSHDRELLNLLDLTFELTREGIGRYGGNYDFYRQQRDTELDALRGQVEDRERELRAARQTARQAAERKQKQDARGEGKQKKEGTPRIMMGGLKDGAEKSASRLKELHAGKMEGMRDEMRAMKEKLPDRRDLKIALDDSSLHKGKMLVECEEVNFNYAGWEPLWSAALDLKVFSGDRLGILGANGSGKTTLLKLILGELQPTSGTIVRAGFTHVYIDQEYSLVDNGLTVLQQLEKYNRRNLPDHELKTELHRFLFPAAAWDKLCGSLSGGEKMRLMLCCLLVSDDAPDMFVLDEPTNNLDISSMQILTSTIAAYKGTVLVISHDSRFMEETGVSRMLDLTTGKIELR